jgi:hypothetical protein
MRPSAKPPLFTGLSRKSPTTAPETGRGESPSTTMKGPNVSDPSSASVRDGHIVHDLPHAWRAPGSVPC